MAVLIFIFHVICFFALPLLNFTCCKGEDKGKAQGKKLQATPYSDVLKPKSGPKSISEEKPLNDAPKTPVKEAPKPVEPDQHQDRSHSDPVDTEKPKHGKILVREMSEESQMSKSIMRSLAESSLDMPSELDLIHDPFDCQEMPLPPNSAGATTSTTTPMPSLMSQST